MSMQAQIDGLSRKLAAIKEVEVPRAIASAINKTAKKTHTQIAKAVKQETGIAASVLKNRFYMRPANAKKLYSRITVYRRDIPAIALGVAQTRLRTSRSRITGGGSIKVGNKTFKNAFVNRVRTNGTWHVLQRTQGTRYPIDVVKVKVAEAVDKHAKKITYEIYERDFQRTLINDLKFRISKYAKS